MERIQLDILESLGMDYEETLERFVNDEDFYFQLLEKFFEKPDIDIIEEMLEQENYQEAFRLAHSLKGGSANMGLLYLSEAMVPLTEELRNPPYEMEKILPLYYEARDSFKDTMEQVKIVLEARS